MTVEFKKIKHEISVLNPMKAFQEDTQHAEIRFDPLTGVKRLFNVGIAEKAKMFYQPVDENLLEMIANKTKETCIFCPQNLEKVTPKFPAELLPEGRFRKGDSWVFPNLFQVYEIMAIGVIGKEHFLRTDEFSPEILKNCFSTIIDFLKVVNSRKPELKYASFGMNYLPPAASSQVHPHNQIYMSKNPFYYVDWMMKESKTYLDKKSKNFWDDLIETEKELGERYVGKTGNVEWIASFAPMASNEFIGIIPEKSNYFEYDDKDLDGIAEGLSKILCFYKKDLQMESFNYILYSGPLGDKSDSFRASVKIATRPNFNGNYINDIHFAPLFNMENWFANPPEYLAGRLRAYF
jgi:galactose-1-phosphate uridylyltransferase